MNAKVKAKALKTLDGMEQIVRNEMMKPGMYVGPMSNPTLRANGSVCGGREYCLIGAAWIAYGGSSISRGSQFLDGIYSREDRDGYMRNRPGLRVAYDALNRVADRRIARLPKDDRERVLKTLTPLEPDGDLVYAGSSAEALFEETEPGRLKLLSLIASARKEIETAA